MAGKAQQVLITRAQPVANLTAKAVATLGFAPLVVPLTRLQSIAEGLEVIGGLDANLPGLAVATSMRAVETLVEHGCGNWVKARAWAAVGSRTGEALEHAGAKLYCTPARTSQDLVQVLSGSSKPMIYPCAVDRRPDLEKALPTLSPVPIYRMQEVGGFDAQAKVDLGSKQPNLALVYSPRSARLLSQAIQSAGLEEELSTMGWLCLSGDVAEAAPQAAKLWVAKEPTEASLLQLLASFASAPS